MELPVRMDDGPEKQRLLEELRSGNTEVIEILILGHTRLIWSVGRQYLRKYGQWIGIDDLVGATVLRLVESLTRISKGETEISDNLGLYIVWLANNTMQDCVAMISDIKVPLSTQRSNNERPPHILKVGHEAKIDIRDHIKEMEVRELLNIICENEFERVILMFKERGFSDKEIGSLIKCSTSTVWKTRKELEKRYEKLATKVR